MSLKKPGEKNSSLWQDCEYIETIISKKNPFGQKQSWYRMKGFGWHIVLRLRLYISLEKAISRERTPRAENRKEIYSLCRRDALEIEKSTGYFSQLLLNNDGRPEVEERIWLAADKCSWNWWCDRNATDVPASDILTHSNNFPKYVNYFQVAARTISQLSAIRNEIQKSF